MNVLNSIHAFIPALIFALTAVKANIARAEIQFEGYYRIEADAKHVGFAVVRWERDPPSKNEIVKYFLHTADLENVMHRILSTEVFDPAFRPVRYEQEESTDDKPSKYVVSFRKGGLFDVAYQAKGFSQEKKTGDIPEGAFLSQEINRVLAANKPAKGKVYKYLALNESKAVFMDGQVSVLDSKKIGGHTVYRMFDDFNVPPEEIWMLDNGQILKLKAPDRNVTCTLVHGADEAIGSLEFNRSELIKLFGEIPRGTMNPVSTGKIGVGKSVFPSKIDTRYHRVPNPILLRVPASARGSN